MLPTPYKGAPFNRKHSYQLINQPTHQLKNPSTLLHFLSQPLCCLVNNQYICSHIYKETILREQHNEVAQTPPCPTISYPNNRI